MVHILFTILKVLGILIAFLLGLVLLLLFIILFGPIGYEAEGKMEEDKDVKAKLTWLFFVIRGDVQYRDQKLTWFFRIFGITAASNEERFLKKKEEKRKRKEEREKKKELKEAAPEKEAAPQKEATSGEVKTEGPGEKTESEKESKTESKGSGAEQRKENTEKKPKKERKPKLGDLIKKISNALKQAVEKVKQIPAKIKQLIQKIREMLETGARYRDFFCAEENKKVFSYLIIKLKKMAGHILPRRFRGTVEFGLADPYMMGQVLAVLGMLLPIYQDKLTIRPDFEEQKLNGNFYLKGRIIPGYLLLQCLLILCKKEVRRLIRDGRKLIGGNK